MKRITLTFDNGPSPEITPFVLEQLDERKLRAIFCVVGSQLSSPIGIELARSAFQQGHRLVNHSLTHQVALGDDPTTAHASTEIADMHALMNATLGDWGDPWFRPFGHGGKLGPHIFSTAALETLAELHYSVLLWNSVPRDWEDPDGWVDTALADVARHTHTVLVLHDLPTGAMINLPRFLDELASRDIDITDEIPAQCIPMRDGTITGDVASLRDFTRE